MAGTAEWPNSVRDSEQSGGVPGSQCAVGTIALLVGVRWRDEAAQLLAQAYRSRSRPPTSDTPTRIHAPRLHTPGAVEPSADAAGGRHRVWASW